MQPGASKRKNIPREGPKPRGSALHLTSEQIAQAVRVDPKGVEALARSVGHICFAMVSASEKK